jgi:hypothetical protein
MSWRREMTKDRLSPLEPKKSGQRLLVEAVMQLDEQAVALVGDEKYMPSHDLVVGDDERTTEHKLDRPSLWRALMYVRDEVFPRQPIGWKDQREVGTDYVAIQQVVIVSKCLNPSQVLNPDLWITENDKGHRLIIRSLQLPPATDERGRWSMLLQTKDGG